MKSILCYLTILFLFVSCHGQETNKSNTIDASKVKEITITNKMYCSVQKLTQGSIVIKDQDQIEKIIKTFTYSEKEQRSKGDVDIKNNIGFFDISFNEEDKSYFYSIIYTTYNGVILINNNNGDMYKNDRLEGVVNPLFIAK